MNAWSQRNIFVSKKKFSSSFCPQQHGSASGAVCRHIARWVRRFSREDLEFFALHFPTDPWQKLADICHLNPKKVEIIKYWLAHRHYNRIHTVFLKQANRAQNTWLFLGFFGAALVPAVLFRWSASWWLDGEALSNRNCWKRERSSARIPPAVHPHQRAQATPYFWVQSQDSNPRQAWHCFVVSTRMQFPWKIQRMSVLWFC